MPNLEDPVPVNEQDPTTSDPTHHSRITLIWEVLVLQVKLVADGLRDVMLVPLSLGAALLGLIAGGNDPGRLYRKVMLLGRRSERWINLFGYRKHGTADELINPFKEKVDASPIARKAGTSINRSLDRVNEHLLRDKDEPQ
ncbi:MAG: hypothetical protein RIC89_14750 [Pseudomonadales bacterium]